MKKLFKNTMYVAVMLVLTQSCSKESNNAMNPWEKGKKEKTNSLSMIQESSKDYLLRDTPYVSDLVDTPYRKIPVMPKAVNNYGNNMYRDTPYVSMLVDTPYRKMQPIPKNAVSNNGYFYRDTPYISLVVDTPYRRVLLTKK